MVARALAVRWACAQVEPKGGVSRDRGDTEAQRGYEREAERRRTATGGGEERENAARWKTEARKTERGG